MEETSKENLTAKFFQTHWDEVYPMLVELVGCKFRKAKEADQVQDLVMTFVVGAIGRDSFRPAYRDGKYPTMGSVRLFVTRSTIDQLRTMGTDLGCRVMFGSRTSREYIKDIPVVLVPNPEFGIHLVDKVRDDIENRVYLREKIKILENMLVNGVEKSRHLTMISIFHKLMEGHDKRELVKEFKEQDVDRVKEIMGNNVENW